MSDKGILEEIEKRLNAKTIHDLRQVARAVGVPRPADGRKERIVEYMLKIASGEADPAMPSVRGAHPKSVEYDRQLVADILRCREISLSSFEEREADKVELTVSSGEEEKKPYEFTSEGLLERRGDKWFIRTNGGDFLSDVFVNVNLLNMFGLREGDMVKCKCARVSPDEFAGAAAVLSVNGLSPVSSSARRNFESLTPVYPDRKFSVALGGGDLPGRMVDLFSPVGAGQRAFVEAVQGSDKTAFLKLIAEGLQKNNPRLKIVILLIDAAPEVAADFRRTFTSADVFISSIEAGAAGHVRTASLALEYSKRRTELLQDVVMILDDITALTRAYNSCGKQVTASLDYSALDNAKRFLAAARNAEEGGSLTIISALNAVGGDPLDSAVYSGLKDIGNMRIALLPQTGRDIKVDVFRSFAAGQERLLSESELNAAYTLRENYSAEQILQLFKETDSNDGLCTRLKNK